MVKDRKGLSGYPVLFHSDSSIYLYVTLADSFHQDLMLEKIVLNVKSLTKRQDQERERADMGRCTLVATLQPNRSDVEVEWSLKEWYCIYKKPSDAIQFLP